MDLTLINNKLQTKKVSNLGIQTQINPAFESTASLTEVEKDLLNEVGADVLDYYKGYPFLFNGQVIYLSTIRHYIYDAAALFELNTIINLRLINGVAHLRYFLYNINRTLPLKGYYLGCYENRTSQKQRLLSIKPALYGKLSFFLFFFFHNLLPRIPILRFVYLFLYRGGMKCVSKEDLTWLLKRNGFTLTDSKVIRGKSYFIAQKTKNFKKENLSFFTFLYDLKKQPKIIKF